MSVPRRIRSVSAYTSSGPDIQKHKGETRCCGVSPPLLVSAGDRNIYLTEYSTGYIF